RVARGVRASRAGVAPGPAQGAGESGEPLDGPDGVCRAPRGADGQQHGRAGAAWAGGGAEELLRFRCGVGGASGGDAVLVIADAVLVGLESACVVDSVLDGV